MQQQNKPTGYAKGDCLKWKAFIYKYTYFSLKISQAQKLLNKIKFGASMR